MPVVQLGHQIDLRSSVAAPESPHAAQMQAQALDGVPLQPLSANLLKDRPAHILGQPRSNLAFVNGARIGELQTTGQRPDKAVPEGQKRIGDAIDRPAIGAFSKGKLPSNPTQFQKAAQGRRKGAALHPDQLLHPVEFRLPPAMTARMAL